jgi:hypothetical protein
MNTKRDIIKVGDVLTSFPRGVVVDVSPYRGRYPQWFTRVARIRISNGGHVEMAFDDRGSTGEVPG